MVKKKNENEYLNAMQDHLDGEFGRALNQAEWYRDHSKQLKRKYYYIRIPAIIIGVSLPPIIALQTTFNEVLYLPVVASLLALFGAIFTSLDTFLKYGETWAEENAAELAIYSLLRRYGDERLKINFAQNEDSAEKVAEDILESFRNEYEQIVGQTVKAFTQRAKLAAAAQIETK